MEQTRLFPEMPNCGKCGLYRKAMTPRMKPFGHGKYKGLIVGEASGATEDELGRPFVGDSGKLLRYLFEQHGYDLDDFRVMNAVSCHPLRNKKPTNSQIKYCRPMVLREIERFKPNVIFLVGEIAVKSVIGKVWTRDQKGISRWRGFPIPDQTYKAWLVPIYHPSYLLRNQNDVVLEDITLSDIGRGLRLLGMKVPDYKKLYENYDLLIDKMDIYLLLETVLDEKPKYMAFDYETNALKPYGKDRKIRTISLCYNNRMSYSFPLDMNDKRMVGLWKNILTEKSIGKISHNMKFEQIWSIAKFGVRVRNWVWDTMLMAHWLDNRSDITSLDFQIYLNFGLYGYSAGISKYLRSEKNTTNKVFDAPLAELIRYNALDSYFTFLLFEKQRQMDINKKCDMYLV